jgi:hypothetical protein
VKLPGSSGTDAGLCGHALILIEVSEEGVDLHNRNLYACVVGRDGEIHCHRSMRSKGRELLRVIEPFQGDVAVAVECTFAWYWVADLCRQHDIPFALGHALHMKAILPCSSVQVA